MFTKRVDRRWLHAWRWCAIALAMGGAVVASAQFGGRVAVPAQNAGNGQTPEQRLYPMGLPKMEAMLKSALDHHPEVLAARSKLRAAEAELRQSELAALKDVMHARARWEVARRNADDQASPENLGDLAAIEWELAFLLGTRGVLPAEGAAASPSARTTLLPAVAIPTKPAVLTDVLPHAKQAATFKELLDQKIECNLQDAPLAEVSAFLSKKSGLRFVLDKQMLEGDGFPVESPITLDLGEVELGTALQALEDLHKPLYFVVRDYGILVTTESSRSSRTVAARDFWKLTEDELRAKLQQQRQEEMGFGGMGGGGMMGGGGGFF
jgi:hypothetical protein